MNRNTIVQGAISLRDSHFAATVAEKTLEILNITCRVEFLTDDSVAIYMSSNMGKDYDAVCVIHDDARPVAWGLPVDEHPDMDEVMWWQRYAEVVTSINQTRFSFVNESDRVDMNYFGPEDIKSFL